MSFSDQQGCPQIFNIRPIDLHYVFSVFPSQNLPKAAYFMPCLAKRFSMLRMTYPCPMPIQQVRSNWKMGEFFPTEMEGKASGNSEFPRSTCQVAPESPKKERFFLLCLPTIQQVAGVTDGIFLMAFVPSSFWQNINIGDS